ncbi:POL2A, partial [Symbiodinium necroappetens]
MASMLQDLRDEWQAFENLLDGLYGWLASPTSLLYDAALLRRVHQYMDRVLKILLDVVRRNGCTVIHASHSK